MVEAKVQAGSDSAVGEAKAMAVAVAVGMVMVAVAAAIQVRVMEVATALVTEAGSVGRRVAAPGNLKGRKCAGER